jgi:hypothetical protein
MTSTGVMRSVTVAILDPWSTAPPSCSLPLWGLAKGGSRRTASRGGTTLGSLRVMRGAVLVAEFAYCLR